MGDTAGIKESISHLRHEANRLSLILRQYHREIARLAELTAKVAARLADAKDDMPRWEKEGATGMFEDPASMSEALARDYRNLSQALAEVNALVQEGEPSARNLLKYAAELKGAGYRDD